MEATLSDIDQKKLPTRRESFVFFLKSRILMSGRLLENLKSPVKKHAIEANLALPRLIGESRTPLWAKSHKLEMDLTAGKVHNLRIICKKLDGVVVREGEIFSFWKQVGRTTKRKGYVVGREIREGCIIPTRGGGICQLTNALYDCALKSGFEIIERHGHTEVIPGSLAEINRDATVFWNYVDLRFRHPKTFRISAVLNRSELIVRFYSDEEIITKDAQQSLPKLKKKPVNHVGNCYTCGETSCHKNVQITRSQVSYGKTAFVLDEHLPNLNTYLNDISRDKDYLFLPLDGRKRHQKNYAWLFNKKLKTSEQKLITLKRSLNTRKLKSGSQLQAVLFKYDRLLAEKMAREIPYDVSHVVVSQNLLPHIWKTGILGGRSFDVVSNRLPMRLIQAQLDKAFEKHPNSNTLKDFRIDESFLELEDLALQQAKQVITDHAMCRDYFGDKAVFIAPEFNIQSREKPSDSKGILFGSTPFGRKGILEFIEAAKGLNIPLFAPGASGETPLIRAMFEPVPADWKSSVKAVFLPAYVAHHPRLIYEAIEAGIPVYISKFVGIEARKNVHIIEEIEADQIRQLLEKILAE